MMDSAKQFIEDKHYEFSASVSLLITDEKIREKLNASASSMYEKMQGDIEKYQSELQSAVNKALKNDGVIDPEEEKVISAKQEKINLAVDKVNDAETKSRFETLSIKYGGNSLDRESYQKLQAEVQVTSGELAKTYEEAMSTSLNTLELEKEQGLDHTEYKTQYGLIKNAYNENMDALNKRVGSFQIEMLKSSYGSLLDQGFSKMNMQGTTQENISRVMQNAANDGVDVSSWDTKTASKYLGLNNVSSEDMVIITKLLSEIAKTMQKKASEEENNVYHSEKPEAPKTYEIKNQWLGVAVAFDKDNIKEQCKKVRSETEELVTKMSQKTIAAKQEVAVGLVPKYKFEIPSKSVLDKWLLPQLQEVPKDKTIVPKQEEKEKANNLVSDHIKSAKANGGIVNSRMLSWLGEEGPEAVIPLTAKRRNRAKKLYEKTGYFLGIRQNTTVPDTIKNTGSPFGTSIMQSVIENNGNAGQNAHAKKEGGQSIQVSIGSTPISIEIHSQDSSVDIVSQISSKKKEVINALSEMLNEAFQESFENMPLAN